MSPDDRGGAACAAGPSEESAWRDGIDQSTLPVFQQKWWVAATQGSGCHEARIFKDRTLVGSLPYVVRRTKVGTRWGAPPDWAHLGGPVVSQMLTDAEKSDVLARLIAQLPKNVSYGFVCSSYTDDAPLVTRAFTDAGFTHFTEKTYYQSPSEPDVLSRLKRKHRLHLESARRELEIVELGEGEFIDFYSANLADVAVRARLPLASARALIARASPAGRSESSPREENQLALRSTPRLPVRGTRCATTIGCRRAGDLRINCTMDRTPMRSSFSS